MKLTAFFRTLEPPVPKNWASTGLEEGELRKRTARGGVANALGELLGVGVHFLGIALLGRLLEPPDFGLVAKVAVAVALLSLFQDLGLAAATIQREKINQRQLSNLFWINVAAGVLLLIVGVILAPLIAAFYGEPLLRSVFYLLSVSFLASSLGVQHRALLSRHMLFGSVALVRVCATFGATLLGVVLAFSGFGYWSLVWMAVAVPALSSLGFVLRCRWVPGRPGQIKESAEMLGFGASLTGANFLNFFSRNLDKVLLGKFSTDEQLGYYERSYKLVLFSIHKAYGPLAHVAVPALSRLQKQPPEYCRFFRRMTSLCMFAMVPIAVLSIIYPVQIIAIMLGEGWEDAAPVFGVLAVTALIQPLRGCCGWVLVSLGRSRQVLLWGFIAAPTFAIAFAVGVGDGALGVAYAFAIANLLLLPAGVWFALRDSPLSLTDIVASAKPALVSGLVGGLAAVLYNVSVGGHLLAYGHLLYLGVGALVFSSVYFTLGWFSFDLRKVFVSMTSALKR